MDCNPVTIYEIRNNALHNSYDIVYVIGIYWNDFFSIGPISPVTICTEYVDFAGLLLV